MSKIYTNPEVIDYVWQYSKYHGNLMGYCDQLADEGNGHIALISLLNITEMIFKDKINDYDEGFFKVIKKLRDRNSITQPEYVILNNPNNGVRRIRNLLAHANLSKYNIIFKNEGKELLYPLTENETCIKLYNIFSPIIFNIILKLISEDLIVDIEIDLESFIKEINIEIKEISPEKILEHKGLDYKEIEGWSDMNKETKYRLAENSSDVNFITEIFKNLF